MQNNSEQNRDRLRELLNESMRIVVDLGPNDIDRERLARKRTIEMENRQKL